MRTALFSLAAVLALFLFPAAVSAADGSGDTDANLEVTLLAMAPIVVLLATIVIGPEAGDAVKRLIPGVMTGLVAVVYYLGTNFPGVDGWLATNVVLLGTMTNRVYEWINGATQLAFGKRLNELTGPGLFGRADTEGD